MKHEYTHHWFKDFHSTVIAELPDDDNIVAVRTPTYWEAQRHGLGMPQRNLKADTAYYAFVMLRENAPDVIGEGKTKDEAVNNLLAILRTYSGSTAADERLHRRA